MLRSPLSCTAASVQMVVVGMLALAPALSAEVSDPGCGTLKVPMRANTVVYRLPHTFIRAGSDSVTWAGTGWTRGRDYVLDVMRGELRLLRQPIAGDTLLIQACWLLDPPPIEARFARYRAASAAVADTGAVSSAPTPAFPTARWLRVTRGSHPRAPRWRSVATRRSPSNSAPARTCFCASRSILRSAARWRRGSS